MELQKIYQSVVDGSAGEVQAGVQAALAEGVAADVILNQALIAAMEEVGKRFEEGDFFVPEMLIAARAMQSGLGLLKPHLIDSGVKAAGKVAMGTVKGDLHDIGKNLVAMMLEGAGFEVQDLGSDVDSQKFVQAAQDGANIIGMSALLTTTMSYMQTTIQALQTAGLRDTVKVVIGGAPVTDAYAKQVGADAFAPDASSAVRIIKQLVA
ncbi:MAG: methyltransferase [Anaerolineae bacterium UTCFX2]|jgi:5-methyltetrahydrofolate--homocysteine methyltransferase|nr:MAG: methyltransferase [Anaerolineae bacterium UTCFX2]